MCVTMLCISQTSCAAQPDEKSAPNATESKASGKAKEKTPEEKEAAYTKTLEKRTAEIVTLLDVKDETKLKNVREALMSQYRFINDWHSKNDAEVKALSKKNDEVAKAELENLKAPLKAQHQKFVSQLEANLTPEQVEQVKNYIVKSKLPVTYKAYCDMLPQLTEEQKAKVYEILKQGREEAMDAGSSEEKTAIFGKYKGKVNIYLSGLGINMKEAEKEWKVRREASKSDGASDEKKAATPKDEKK